MESSLLADVGKGHTSILLTQANDRDHSHPLKKMKSHYVQRMKIENKTKSTLYTLRNDELLTYEQDNKETHIQFLNRLFDNELINRNLLKNEMNNYVRQRIQNRKEHDRINDPIEDKRGSS